MAGTFVSIDYDDREVESFLRRIVEAGARPRGALDEIGVELSQRWGEPRFLSQSGPDGTPWAPLSAEYAAWKKAETASDLILVLHGHLMDSIAHQTSERAVRIGTNRVYGATHQFGDPGRNIPARPFIGVSEADKDEIVEILEEHITRALRSP